jgi:hypothetical protein
MSTTNELKDYTWRPSPKTELSHMRDDLDKFKANHNTDKTKLPQADLDTLVVYSKFVTRLEEQWAKADKSTTEKREKAQMKLRKTGLPELSAAMGGWMRQRGYLNKERRLLVSGFGSKGEGLPQCSKQDPSMSGLWDELGLERMIWLVFVR